MAGAAASTAFQLVRVEDDSMMPTLKDGDYLIAARRNQGFLTSRITAKDAGKVAIAFVGGGWIVKRLTAREGDTVVSFSNGSAVALTAGKSLDAAAYASRGAVVRAVIVPRGRVFLLGDNLEESVDSRELGFVDENAIKGIVVMPRRID